MPLFKKPSKNQMLIFAINIALGLIGGLSWIFIDILNPPEAIKYLFFVISILIVMANSIMFTFLINRMENSKNNKKLINFKNKDLPVQTNELLFTLGDHK